MDALEQYNAETAAKDASTLTEGDEQFDRLKDEFLEDDEHNRSFRERCDGDFAFAGAKGKQWDEADEAILKDQQGRVPIVFNRVNTICQAVVGLEISTRTEAAFYPLDAEDEGEARANEVLSAGIDWMGDQCKAHRHQTQAFRNAFICGLGVTEAVVDFEDSRRGKYIERRINPKEFRWDCSAREPNLVDAERLARARQAPLRKAQQMFPNIAAEELDAIWASPLGTGENRAPADKGTDKVYDARATVTLVHSQWIEREDYYLAQAQMPQLGGLDDMQAQAFAMIQQELGGEQELSKEEFDKYKQLLDRFGIPFDFVKLKRKAYKQAFLGRNQILGKVRPAPCKTHFNWNFVTYDLDETGIPYGGVALMRDPQRFANKWLSQTLHILNSTAKGGIIAERDAFDDIEEAKRSYAKSEAITLVKPGTIGKNKIMAKPGAGLSAPYLQLTEFAIAAIRDAVGVSLELLGMRDATQPGILEHQRKQAGLTILAPLFDAHKEFKERNAIVRLYYLQNIFSDGRMIPVVGQDGQKQFLRLTKDRTFGEYHTEIGEAPTSPNQKEQNWMLISQILPLFKEVMSPDEIVLALEYSPLPVRFVSMLKKKLQQPPSPEEIEAKSIAKAAALADIDKKKASADKDRAAAMKAKLDGVLEIIDKAMMARREQIEQAQRMAVANAPQDIGIEGILRRLAAVESQPMAANPNALALPPQTPELGAGGGTMTADFEGALNDAATDQQGGL